MEGRSFGGRRPQFGGGGGGGGGGFGAPVNVGDEFNVTIEAVGEKGDGLAKKDGFVLFVPNTKQGDNVKIKITRVLKKVGFAEVVGQGSGAAFAAPRDQEDSEPEFKDEEPSQDSEDFGEDSGDSSDDLAEDSDEDK